MEVHAQQDSTPAQPSTTAAAARPDATATRHRARRRRRRLSRRMVRRLWCQSLQVDVLVQQGNVLKAGLAVRIRLVGGVVRLGLRVVRVVRLRLRRCRPLLQRSRRLVVGEDWGWDEIGWCWGWDCVCGRFN